MGLIALTVVAATAAGVAAHRLSPGRAPGWARGLLRLMLYGLLPPVVFFNVARLELTAEVGAGLAVAWCALVIVVVVAHLAGRRLLGLDRRRTGALMAVSLHGNTGYFGLPLAAAVLGTDALSEAVVYDVLVGTPSLLIGVFAIGAAYGATAGATVGQRAAAFVTRNPPLWAAVAGLLAPDALAPDALVDASRVLVFALLPLGFVAVGITLAQEELRLPPAMSRRIAVALALRLAVAPALLLALAAPVVALPDAYVLLAAMPTGLNGLLVAHEYGLDVPFAAAVIAWSTTIVLVTATVAQAVAG